MKKKTFNILLATIIVLTLPSLFYALNTQFALIDDLSDWNYIHLTLREWLRSAFDFSCSDTRYRPTWELYNWFTWSLFGNSSFLHHLFRIVLRLFIVLISCESYKLIFKTSTSALRLSYSTFLAFFIFFPIAPDARLAPQELTLVLFFSIESLIVLKVLLNHEGDIFQNKRLYFSSIIVYFLLLGSKEAGISIGFGFLAFMVIIVIKEKKKLIVLLPHVIIFLICTIKIYGASKIATYGKEPITFSLITQNLRLISEIVFELKTSAILTTILLLPFYYFLARFIKLKKPFVNLGIVSLRNLNIIHYYVINFIGFFLISLTFWSPYVYRYYFPMMYIWIFILGLCVGHMYQNIMNINLKNVFVRFLIVCSIYFIAANYYNYISQYSMQYHTRNNEHKLLNELSEVLNIPVNNVILRQKIEYDKNVLRYFQDYNEFFNKETKSNIKISEKNDDSDTKTFFVSRNPVPVYNEIVFTTTENNDDIFLSKAKDISYLVLRENKKAWVDPGASQSSTWTIYRNVDILSTPPLLEDSSDIILKGDKVYNEIKIEIGENINVDENWAIEITYETRGKARPFVIVYGTPYSKDSRALHDLIPLTDNKINRIVMYFNKKNFVLNAPLLIFRNWSDSGTYIIHSYAIYRQ